MSVLSSQSIRAAGIFSPFHERSVHAATGLTYGCGAASYDLRLGEDARFLKNMVTLTYAMEHISLPPNVCGVVHDKSSLARIGILVQNTFIDPGWHGYLTLEISYHQIRLGGQTSPAEMAMSLRERMFLDLKAGTPIAHVALHQLDQPTETPYAGRYQNQLAGAKYSHFKFTAQSQEKEDGKG